MHKATVFICNPRPDSLTYRFAGLARAVCVEADVEVSAVDLYRDGIDPFLTPQQAASYNDGVVYPDMSGVMASLRQSSTLCFVFPVWMYGIASPLKGLLEKIVRPGITFRITPDGAAPLLTNITRLCVICSSGQADNFSADDSDPVEYSFRKLAEDNFAAACSHEYLRLFGADHITPDQIEVFEAAIKSRLGALLEA
jgi:NAD(P)H dehydrogenase (quinone)